MTMLQHGLVPSTGGYQIERSLRFNSADSAYLNRTPGSAGNRKTWTWSGWVKRSKINSTNFIFTSRPSLGAAFFLYFDQGTGDNALRIAENGGGGSDLITTQLFRDVSAWYHIVVAWDTTQATASNRVKIYVNGVQVTAFATSTYPTLNADSEINNTSIHSIGSQQTYAAGNYLDGYLADVHFIDGSALTPSSFGENDTDTGVWKPKAYTGSYGTNGFKLTFSDNSGTTATTLGKDSSGNGNNWTPNNFSVTAGAGNDSLVDTPTPYGSDTGAGGEVRGNYATLNAVETSTNSTLSNGNLSNTISGSGGSSHPSTISMTSGKWYWEITEIGNGGNQAIDFGVLRANISPATVTFSSSTTGAYYRSGGNKVIDGTATSYGSGWSSAGVTYVVGAALDVDAGTITFYLNGVSQGAVTLPSNTNGWKAHAFWTSSSGSGAIDWNFGQRPFAYTAPSGYKALCTTNLPTPAIGATASTRADDYFNTVLYTGNGSTQSITGVGFQPDLVWIKSRSAANNNILNDAVRGTMKTLFSNHTLAEYTDRGVGSFDSDGFSITTANNDTNQNGATFVAWNWKANGAGSSNTQGTITSTVSANTTSGFSVVTYTGTGSAATIGHGLGVAPSMIITKARSNTSAWAIYHVSLGATKGIEFDTAAAATSDIYWNNTAPTSTVFSVKSGTTVNASGYTYVGYCFAEVAGFSKFGSYTGNGSNDGPFVYTGFRPRYVMIKVSSGTTGNWDIFDTSRSSYNLTQAGLLADSSAAEYTAGQAGAIDILSNGFKIRSTDQSMNTGSATYIYAAFAEVPQKFSLAR